MWRLNDYRDGVVEKLGPLPPLSHKLFDCNRFIVNWVRVERVVIDKDISEEKNKISFL